MQPLNEILSYTSEKTITRFLKLYDLEKQQAEDIFQETLKFLYLCAHNETQRLAGDQVPSMGITYHMFIIDEMWHAFILNTREYEAFCKKYLKQFVHHPPGYYSAYNDFKEDQESKEFKEKLSYIYDFLGEDTVVKWFSTYLDEYNFKKMKNFRKF